MSNNISTYYGGSLLGMCGKNSVIIVGDKRLGMGNFTVNTERTSIHQINSKCFIGLSGFLPDCQKLISIITNHIKLFELNENRIIEIDEVKNLVSYVLYSYRTTGPLYLQPIIVGLDRNDKPYAISMDCLGCETIYHYVSIGTAENNLTGICEALYIKDMDEDQLFTNAMQAFINAVDRDALSGWGAECFIITPSKVIQRKVKSRCD